MAKEAKKKKDPYFTKVESIIGAMMVGKETAALDSAGSIIAKYPDRPEAYFALGIVAYRQGNKQKALDLFNTAHNIAPETREYVDALSVLYTLQGSLAEGLYFAKLSTALEPNPLLKNLLPDNLSDYFRSLGATQPSAHYVFAMAAFNSRDFRAAAEECEKELAFNRGHEGACRLLAKSSLELGNFPRAVEASKSAIALAPGVAENFIVLGDSLMHVGEFVDAVEAYRVAISLDTVTLKTATAAFYGTRFLDDKLISVQSEFQEEIIRRAGKPQEELDIAPVRPPQDEERKIRIGYISNSLFESELGTRVQTLLSFHNRNRFDVHLYQMSIANDSVKVDVTVHATSARKIYELDDDVVATIIENDQIDILVDLCGYSEDNRLGVLTQRTAPVKIGYLQYPYGLRVPGTNFILSDKITADTDKKALGERQESLLLNYGMFAVRAFPAMQDVQALPAMKKGFITFGGTCDLATITPSLAKTWIKILDAVPKSRILLGNVPVIPAPIRARIKKLFAKHADRIDFLEESDSPLERLEFFHRIDIFLDASPVSGGLSLCEALWMGVPVMTIKGKRHSSKIGASILFSAGKPEWAFSSEKKMIDGIVSLAKDMKALGKIRMSLRDDIAQGTLFNPRVLMNAMETAYVEALGRAEAKNS